MSLVRTRRRRRRVPARPSGGLAGNARSPRTPSPQRGRLAEALRALRRRGRSWSTPTATSCSATTPPSGTGDGRHTDALAEEQINDLLDRARQGQSGDRELQLFGPPREMLCRCGPQPLLTDGEIVGAVVFIRDISEIRRKESVRRDFVANVSHELKTPIGALALLAETMAAGGDEAVVRQLAERVAREADRLGRIIDDLLNLSLIEAQESPSREPVPIPVLIAEAVEAVRPAAAAAGIPLEVADSTCRTSRSRAIDARCVSALTNLLDNAIKYSESPSAVERRVPRCRTAWSTITVTRPRSRDPVARPRAHLRAVLPGRPRPQPGDRWHRPRSVDRPPRRPGPRRRRHRRVARGRGLDLSVSGSPRSSTAERPPATCSKSKR